MIRNAIHTLDDITGWHTYPGIDDWHSGFTLLANGCFTSRVVPAIIGGNVPLEGRRPVIWLNPAPLVNHRRPCAATHPNHMALAAHRTAQ
jgi:hypothetical protein